MKKRPIIIRLSALCLMIILLFFVFKYSGINIEDLSAETIQEFANDNILIIILMMFVIMFFQNLLNFFPIVIVMALNVALFGLWKGFFFSLICSVVACTIIFIIIRHFFHDFSKIPDLEKYLSKIEKKGFWFVFIARLIPIMPTNIINIAAGVSTIKWSHYVIATIFGNAIYGIIIASASSSIL